MKPILSLLTTVSLILFGPIAVTNADTTITQVTSNSYEDSLPRTDDNYIVWQGFTQTDENGGLFAG